MSAQINWDSLGSGGLHVNYETFDNLVCCLEHFRTQDVYLREDVILKVSLSLNGWMERSLDLRVCSELVIERLAKIASDKLLETESILEGFEPHVHWLNPSVAPENIEATVSSLRSLCENLRASVVEHRQARLRNPRFGLIWCLKESLRVRLLNERLQSYPFYIEGDLKAWCKKNGYLAATPYVLAKRW